MSLIGMHLTLLIGPTIPLPAAPPLIDALDNVQVTHDDEGRSGFQLIFKLGRSGAAGLIDFPLLLLPQLKVFHRTIITATINNRRHVLIDGIITNVQMNPSNEPGKTTLTVTGEDISFEMDKTEEEAAHPAQNDMMVAIKLIFKYARFGMIPMTIPPITDLTALPTQRIPMQRGTDLAHLKLLAERHGYVFYVIPGPEPLTNTAYWGPPVRLGVPQPALSLNMGSSTNVSTIDFQHDALAPTKVKGKVQDSTTDQTVPLNTFGSLRLPLAALPTLVSHANAVRTELLDDLHGKDAITALARAQSKTDKSADSTVTATGELDSVRYGHILSPRALVGVRGAGYLYDGLYYVKSVTHEIKRGAYKQKFTLNREGLGSTVPAVVP